MSFARRGAAAGAAATVVMSMHMAWMRRSGRVDALGPEHVTDALFRSVPVEPSRRQHVVATTVAHLGFGSTAGAVLALAGAGRRLPHWAGTAYGFAVAGASYQGWVPALGILPPLTEAPSGRRSEIVGSHLVYGNTLAWLLNKWLARA